LIINAETGLRSGDLKGRVWDIFVLAGEIATAAGVVRAGQYAYIPGGKDSGRFEVRHNTELFVGYSAPEERDGPILICDPDKMPWETRLRDNVPLSKTGTSTNYVKFFRFDLARQETVGLGGSLPHSGLDLTEWHDAIDEVIMLQGEMLVVGNNGEPLVQGAGNYLWRPSRARHLPKYSLIGSLSFFRTFAGGWGGNDIGFERNPRWESFVEAYKKSWADRLLWGQI
jgi:hypothetical protein